MSPMPQPTPPTVRSLRVLRRVMKRSQALEWLVDFCGLTITEAAELLDGTTYPAPANSARGRVIQPGKVKPMAGRMAR